MPGRSVHVRAVGVPERGPQQRRFVVHDADAEPVPRRDDAQPGRLDLREVASHSASTARPSAAHPYSRAGRPAPYSRMVSSRR
ncbi:hypothetical protein [Streptomyces sp. NBC_01485]|uniref:hypothetical protein n=1 Tax=Streptomyces sp. NBC_01485 TaxID=2903884 RepID=UPI003FCCD046